ncbi:type IX secretion system sortase PorU [bacterium]|nr:type IX secretion system sortase PorU [bacterium]
MGGLMKQFPWKHMAKFGAVFCLLSVAFAHDGVSVVEETDSYVILDVEPTDWHIQRTENGIIHSPLGAGLDARQGGRVVPVYRRWIGLPSETSARASVLSVQWGEPFDGLPPMGDEEGRPLNEHPHMAGAGLVYMGETELWRHRWVAPLYIRPLQLDAGGVRRLQTMRVRVDFAGSPRGSRTMNDGLVRSMLVNGDRATGWARPEVTRAKARTTASTASWPAVEMVKMTLRTEGIYEVTYEDLQARGIDLSGYDPRTFKLYNNGGRLLPDEPETPRDTTLIENAIRVEGEADGSWDPGDRILFYGRSVNHWEPGALAGTFRHVMNPFTFENVYWLAATMDGTDGKRMESLEPDGPITFDADIARSRLYNETESFIWYNDGTPQSGRAWYASRLAAGELYSSNISLTAPVPGQDATLRMSLKRVEGGSSDTFTSLKINGEEVGRMYASDRISTFTFSSDILRDGENSFTVESPEMELMIDWMELSYDRRLETGTGRIDFDRFLDDGVAEVTIDGIDNPYIFDITDFANVGFTRNNPFRAEADLASPHRFIAVNNENLLSPIEIQWDRIGANEYENGLRQNGLVADYIYIVHEDFYESAAALETYIEQRDTVEVMRVKVGDVYDEFSFGLYDPAAIRDFLFFTLNRWNSSRPDGGPPEAVLLIGDGDYDYRNITSDLDDNWIPPYEYRLECRDDWFVEFENDNPTPQYVMARLPVQTSAELESYIERLQTYEMEPDYGPWRSRMILVADDEWRDRGPGLIEETHMRDIERLASDVLPSYMDTEKIYAATYPTTFDPVTSGRLKPAATRDLLEAINAGALMITYMGHGNAHVWAHEQLLVDNRDAQRINTSGREPIFFAGTCSWGHFDRPENEAFFEQLLFQDGGAIGTVAAARNTSGSSNRNFLTNYYGAFFDRENPLTLGECLLLAKVQDPNFNFTTKYYHCFAEPMMYTALPRLDMVVEDVNPTELVSLQRAEVDGEVRQPGDTTPLGNFDGEALITVYDSEDTLRYDFVTGGSVTYTMPGGTLFRGFRTVASGETQAEFIVPRDVTPGNAGWIQLFAYNDEADGIGAMRNLAISPTAGSSDDTTPPEIEIYFEHRGWREGDLVTSQPLLVVDIADSSGINLTGEIGHSIRAVLNGETEVVLTEDFIYSRDSFTNGSLEHRLYDLPAGRNRIEVWAWDNANNPARTTLEFDVVEIDGDLQLTKVYNVPNPFKEMTSFTFESLGAEEGTIKIFTPSGRHIQTIGPFVVEDGFNAVDWYGKDQYGDQLANGVYLYQLKVRGESGSRDEIGKLMRIR